MIVTACMIVRDEEMNIRRCLESISGMADHIIIVDTGSADRTPEMCREYTDKVYSHPWENDFSLHRNQSLDYAPDDTDWIFVIDADEELVGDKEKFRTILGQMPEKVDSVAVELLDMQGQRVHCRYNTARFFRKGKVKYFGLVHNYPMTADRPMAVPGLQLKHYGYDLPPEEKEKKRQRTLPLLERRLETNPYDYPVFFYFAQIYGEMKELEKAIYWAERYADLREEIPNFNPTIYYLLIEATMHKGDWPRCEKWIAEYMRHCPQDLDCAKAILDYGILRQNAYLVAEGSRRFILAYDEYTRNLGSRGGRFVFNYNEKPLCLALYNLSLISFRDGQGLLERLLETLDTLDDEMYVKRVIRNVNTELSAINIGWKNIEEMDRAV